MTPKSTRKLETVPEMEMPTSSKGKGPEPSSSSDEAQSSATPTPINTAPSTTTTEGTGVRGISPEPIQPEKKTQTTAFLHKTRKTHKRHKSWDASSTPSLATEQVPYSYPRSRSRSPLKHGIMEEEEDEEGATQRRQSATSQQSTGSESRHFETLSAQPASEWLKDVVGITMEQWPYSQELLSSAVSLKLEQERTRNAALRVHALQSTIDILKLAVDSNVPPHLIPYMVTSGEITRSTNAPETTVKGEPSKQARSSQKSQQNATSVFKVNIPQQQQFQFHHWQKPGEPKGDYRDERKRKASDEQSYEPVQQQIPQQPQSTYSTPTRQQVPSHRRHQSEANVSHLRLLYENQTHPNDPPQQQRIQQIRQQPLSHQPPQQQQHYLQQPPPPQWGGPQSLGSPYLPSRDHPQQHRPLYYQYQPQPPPPHPKPMPQNYIPPPLPGFQFPRRDQMPPPLRQPQQQSQHQSGSSPVSGKKGDVSFLISTPDNPPK